MRTVLLVSSQSCRSVDADARCKWGRSGIATHQLIFSWVICHREYRVPKCSNIYFATNQCELNFEQGPKYQYLRPLPIYSHISKCLNCIKYFLFCQVLIQCRATYIGSGQRQSFRLLVNSEYSFILAENSILQFFLSPRNISSVIFDATMVPQMHKIWTGLPRITLTFWIVNSN